MRNQALLLVALLVMTVLAGCSSKSTTGAISTGADGQLNTDQAVQDINVKATAPTALLRRLVRDSATRPIPALHPASAVALPASRQPQAKNGTAEFPLASRGGCQSHA